MALQYHTKLNTGDVAPYVLLPGDPKRVQVVASYWDEAHQVADNREHVTYTGTYKRHADFLHQYGHGLSQHGHRHGRTGSDRRTYLPADRHLRHLQDFIKNGDIIVFDSACRYDGTTDLYAPPEYPAAAHYQVINACVAAMEELQYPYHVGTTRTADTFFAGHPARVRLSTIIGTPPGNISLRI